MASRLHCRFAGRRLKRNFDLPPHIICGLPAYLFQAELKADRAGNVTVGAITDAKAIG